MLKYIISSIFFLLIGFSLWGQVPRDIVVGERLAPISTSRSVMMCNEAGTITFGTFTGSSNDATSLDERIYLCSGDFFTIVHNNDSDLSGDPDASTTPGIGYAFYQGGAPTIDGPTLADIITDPTILESTNIPDNPLVFIDQPNGDATFQNIEVLFGQTLPQIFNNGNPVELWFAPITYDAANANQEAVYEGDSGGPCVDVNIEEAFSVVYLNEISISGISKGTSCDASFTIDGGLPEFAALNPTLNDNLEYTVDITNTDSGASVSNISGNFEAEGTVNFSVTAAGNYLITVSDGKSCIAQANISFDIVECPQQPSLTIPCGYDQNNPLARPTVGEVVCLDLNVNQFQSVAGVEFLIEWDTSIIAIEDRGNVRANPAIPNLANGLGLEDIDKGVIIVSWITDDFVEGSTYSDNTNFLNLCFQTKKAGPSGLRIIGREFFDADNNEIVFDVDSGVCPLEVNAAPSGNSLQIRTAITQPCVGEENGKLELTLAGGTPPYRLDLIGDNVGTLPTIEILDTDTIIGGLAPDIYDYSITDATGQATATSIFGDPIIIREVNLVVNIIPEQPKCFGEASGALTAIPLENATNVANIEEYSFVWSNDSTTQEITGLTPGQYEVMVTNPNGCIAMTSNTLGQPRELNISRITAVPATCSGSFDGELRALADGGTGELTYRWDIDTTINEPNIGSLDVGTYQLTVTDEEGCIAGGSGEVGSASTITLTPTIDPISCAGEEDASITVFRDVAGFPSGTEFTYEWFTTTDAIVFEGEPTGVQTTANNLGPDTFMVRVFASSEANPNLSQCFATAEYIIEDPLPLSVETFIDATSNCRADDGRIELEVTGGTGAYNYDWEFKNENIPEQNVTTNIVSNLPSDSVTINITDANDCLLTLDTVISGPPPPVIIEFLDNELPCADDTDGTLQVIAEPGAADITGYRWSHSNSVTGNFAGSLSPAVFYVTVIDENFCETTDSATVSAPPALSFNNADTLQIPCFGEANGSLQLEVNGGVPSYDFNWLDTENEVVASNTFILEDVAAGVYRLIGTDANNCDFETNITLPSLPEIQIDFSDIRGTSCFDNGLNERDGEATAIVSYADGTTGEFEFFWPTGEDSGVSESRVTNLGSGEIELLVFETNGICSAKGSVTIPSPDRLEADPIATSSKDITCNGGTDGAASVMAMGGTSPYTYQWDFQNSTSTSITNLAQGTYTVTFTDANDCIATYSVDIIEPEPLVLDFDFTNNNTRDVVCPDEETGQITVIATGANTDQGNIIYSWQDNIANGPIATDLAPGSYSVTVTDALGCFDSISYAISQPPPIQFSVAPSMDILCNGGVTTLVADPLSFSGGNGGDYTFSIDDSPAQTLDRVFQVRAGEHSIKVYDSAGCEYEETVSIEEPLPINIEFPDAIQDGNNLVAEVELGGEITLNPDIFSPLPIAELSWFSNPADSTFVCNDINFCDNPTVSPLDNVTYTLSIMDQNGCTEEKSILIEVDKNRNVFIPNAFAPNARGFDLNETFRIYSGVGVEMIEFARVFDRWGAMVASIESATLPSSSGIQVWDGKISGQRAPQGVYVYIISITFVDGVNLLYRGDVTVLR